MSRMSVPANPSSSVDPAELEMGGGGGLDRKDGGEAGTPGHDKYRDAFSHVRSYIPSVRRGGGGGCSPVSLKDTVTRTWPLEENRRPKNSAERKVDRSWPHAKCIYYHSFAFISDTLST